MLIYLVFGWRTFYSRQIFCSLSFPCPLTSSRTCRSVGPLNDQHLETSVALAKIFFLSYPEHETTDNFFFVRSRQEEKQNLYRAQNLLSFFNKHVLCYMAETDTTISIIGFLSTLSFNTIHHTTIY